ncbi:MAG TPA: hypothetical protein VFR99_07125 [Marmoricola sp.]|nr:hypothetical protein [Marmoricola sp.]
MALFACALLLVFAGSACTKGATAGGKPGGKASSTASAPKSGATSPAASTTTTGAAAGAGIPVYNVYVKNFQYHGMPSTVPANQPLLVSFRNEESFAIQHEFVVLQLPKGKTAQDVVKDAKKKGPDAEDDWIHYADSGDPLDTGSGTVVRMDLPPGHYVATCWQNGKAGGGTGPAHVAIGMIAAFTAK